MSHNHLFWKSYFNQVFKPQLQGIVDTLEDRLLPTFQKIDSEAENISNKVWQDMMSRPGTGDEDPADFAETAQDAGLSHYMLMVGIRQGILNMFSSVLYHTFEQQVLLFHRRELLSPLEENNVRLFTLYSMRERLQSEGIDITSFASWSDIDELRLVSNTVKHADGTSARKLNKRRPDLFANPILKEKGPRLSFDTVHVFQPMVGEDVYVQVRDIKSYLKATLEFWDNLLTALGRT